MLSVAVPGPEQAKKRSWEEYASDMEIHGGLREIMLDFGADDIADLLRRRWLSKEGKGDTVLHGQRAEISLV